MSSPFHLIHAAASEHHPKVVSILTPHNSCSFLFCTRSGTTPMRLSPYGPPFPPPSPFNGAHGPLQHSPQLQGRARIANGFATGNCTL